MFIVLNTGLTYVTAYVIAHLIKSNKGFYKVAIFTPSVISLVVGSMLFLWILNPVSGPVAIVLGWFGLSIPNWTVTEGMVIVILSLIVAWKVFGYNFIVLYSGIVGIPSEIIEAAKLDKISKFRIFTDIIIPMFFYRFLHIDYDDCSRITICLYSYQSSHSGRAKLL